MAEHEDRRHGHEDCFWEFAADRDHITGPEEFARRLAKETIEILRGGKLSPKQ